MWVGGVLTAAFVAVGTTTALLVLPSVTGSATGVARDYLEARLSGDHLKAWNLECESTRSVAGGYDGYVETATHFDTFLHLPDHVAVSLGDLHYAFRGGYFTITATVTSPGLRNRTMVGELPMLFTDGRFQVCDRALGPLGLR